MLINKAYKIEIYPTDAQKELCQKAFGIKRFVYNTLLAKCDEYYKDNKKSYPKKDLKNYITELKQEYKEWMYDVPKSIHQNAFYDLMYSYSTFFNNVKKGRKNKNMKKKYNVYGYPQFKSKKKSKDSFRMDNDRFSLDNQFINFSVFGKIKLSEYNYIPTKDVKYMSATVSYRAGKYFVSVSVEEHIEEVITISKDIIAIDLGIKTLATCSNGVVFENPKAYKKNLDKLKRTQRKFSRRISKKDENCKITFSKRKQKIKEQLQRIHYKISEIRNDNLHKITSYLTKTKVNTIVIEDLNVEGMKHNHKLAQAISDVGFGEFRRQLEYKCKWNNIKLFVVDRWFPSSKTCNNCGNIKEDLKLSDRIYKCECGYKEDRDLNASYNLRDYYLHSI